ncbi:hypothetical protein E2H86_25640 [Pseudomonas putida]|nr:hypothetical protein E2H86_25640 [Pseudomonas putida]
MNCISFYWGLLFIFVFVVLFLNYFFN